MKQNLLKQAAAISLLVFVAILGSARAAGLSTDLQNALSQAQSVNTQISSITLTSDNMCSELLDAHNSAEALIASIEAINGNLSAPMSIDADSLQAMDDLSDEFVSMASASTALSLNITALNNTTDMLRLSNGMNAMLRLSDDIGIMADRILEMSDKILVMADNIGLMADRIITTQQIQSANLALTQSSILATQQNLLALVTVINTSNYESDFDAQILAGNLLSFDISATALTVFNMARKWNEYATDVESLKQQVETTYAALKAAAEVNTVYVDVGSYAKLADLSIMVNSVAIASQGLALATQGMSPVTSDATLRDSMGSVLQLSSDIGIMADRILEMADLILAMSDNIGLTADQVLATQQLQSTNYAATLTSVEATQTIAISIIAVNSL